MRRSLLVLVVCLLLGLAVKWAMETPRAGASALSSDEAAPAAGRVRAVLTTQSTDRVPARDLVSAPADPERQLSGSREPWVVRVSTRYRNGKSVVHTTEGWSVIVTREPVRAAHWHDLPRTGYRFGPALWTSEDGPSGELRVLGDPPLYATLLSGHVVCGTLPIAPDSGQIEFVLEDGAFTTELGTFDFRIVDAQSTRPTDRSDYYYVLPVTTPHTGRHVRFEVGARWDPERHRLVAGRYVLHGFRSAPFGYGTVTFDITPGLVTDLGDILVAASGAVMGETRGPGGEVLDVDIVVRDAATGARLGEVDRRNFKPGFAFGELPPGADVDVSVDDPAWAAAPTRVLAPTSGVQRDFVLTAQHGTPTTFVRSGIDIGLVELRIEAGAGLWCWDCVLTPESEVTVRLVPGKYTLHVDRGPSWGPERIAFHVGAEPARVEVPVSP